MDGIVHVMLPKIKRYLIVVALLQANYDTRFCGLCPNAQSRIKDSLQSTNQCATAEPDKRLLCWDENHCQTGRYY